MFNRSKLLNAKQKISKLKEKYSKNSNSTKGDDVIDFLSSAVLLDNTQTDLDNTSKVSVLRETISPVPVNRLKSPRIEINNLLDDEGEEISQQTFGNNLDLIDEQHSIHSSNHSLSEHSYCSKITSKTLKTESIVLSELSNQFEHICFLSSSSDEEENVPGLSLHPINLTSVPRTGWKIDHSVRLPQQSNQSFDGNSATEQNDDVGLGVLQKSVRQSTSSELSEVQSDVNSIVFSDKEDSAQICSLKVKFESKSSEDDIFKKKEINNYLEESDKSYKTTSNEKLKPTSISDYTNDFNSPSQTQESSFTEPSEKLEIISMSKELNQPQLSKNSLTKQKSKNLKVKTANLKTVQNSKSNSVFKDSEVKYNSQIDNRQVYNDKKLPIFERVSFMPKKPRHRDPTRSKTFPKHSTNFKYLKNRPILKSCALISQNKSKEENMFLSAVQSMTPSKLEGCCYENVISQLLLNQVQLTKHFIHSHHQMYLTCCQAVKVLSEKYNSYNSHIA